MITNVGLFEPTDQLRSMIINTLERISDRKISLKLKTFNTNKQYVFDQLDDFNCYDLVIIDTDYLKISNQVSNSQLSLKPCKWFIDSNQNIHLRTKLLKQGFYDYIPFPFFSEELIAKVTNCIQLLTILKNTSANDQETNSLQVYDRPESLYIRSISKSTAILKGVTLNRQHRYLYYRNMGIRLTRKELQLVDYLVKFGHGLVPFKSLLKEVKITEESIYNPITRNLLSAYISRLRKKLLSIKVPMQIESLYGYGYYLDFR